MLIVLAPGSLAVDLSTGLTRKGLSLLERVILDSLGSAITLLLTLLTLFLQPLLFGLIDVGSKVAKERLVNIHLRHRFAKVFQPNHLLHLLPHQLRVRRLWNKGRTNLLVAKLLKVEFRKEWVRQDLITAFGAQPLAFIFYQQLLNYIFGDVTDTDSVPLFIWPANFGPLDVKEHHIPILIVERWDAREHFVDEDTQGPPV